MKKTVLSIAVVLLATYNYAQKSEVFVKNGYAVSGYDVVAYFNAGKPVEGNKTFAYQWHDANWLFSSKQNLDLFSMNPEKYTPQFGGYCAYGVSEGHKATTKPDAWTIANGKLYLNYDKDVLQLWRKDMTQRIEKAEKNWAGLKDKE
jgi:hypothetical protein